MRAQQGIVMDTAILRDEDGERRVDHPMNSLFAERLQSRLPPGHKLALVNIFTDVASDGAFRTYNMEIRLGNQDAASYHKKNSYVKILSVPEFDQKPGESTEE